LLRVVRGAGNRFFTCKQRELGDPPVPSRAVLVQAGGLRSHRRARTAVTLLPCLLLLAAVWPAAARAHGLVGRTSLPVPTWLFAWAAGAVLVVSSIALPRLWSTPRLEFAPERRLFGIPRAAEAFCGAVGGAIFAVIVYSGVTGSQVPTANLAPTAVFVLFWVGVPVLSALLGDVFRAFSPWRAIARVLAAAARRTDWSRRIGEPLPYPPWLGRWPAVAGILGFAWLELVFVGRQHPATLAVLAVAYALVQLVGMACFGIDRWTENGDAFAVVFGLFAGLSALRVRDGALWRRPPLSGLTALRPKSGTVALLVAMIGTTTFDGFLNGPLWRSVARSLQSDFAGLGLGATTALELALTVGLVGCVLLCAALYGLGIKGMSSVSAGQNTRALARAFAHSLVPIAFGYLFAHYFSLLVIQGQATAYLISDPTGSGADLFGTAGTRIDPGLVSAAAIWYVQVAALVAGHASGLVLAHDRALVLFRNSSRTAAESQRWMLAVMVTFTCLGLWLLSAVNT
jgi:hypothetical protein